MFIYIAYFAEHRPELPPQQAQAALEQPRQAAAWGRPKQQAEAAQQPPVQTSQAQAQRRRPAGAPPSSVAGVTGVTQPPGVIGAREPPLPQAVTPPPGITGARGRTPPTAEPKGT